MLFGLKVVMLDEFEGEHLHLPSVYGFFFDLFGECEWFGGGGGVGLTG